MSTQDPAYAAIEADQEAFARLLRGTDRIDTVIADKEGRTITAADDREYDAAFAAEQAAADALARTLPTTREGAMAMRAYIEERFNSYGCESLLAVARRSVELSPGGAGPVGA